MLSELGELSCEACVMEVRANVLIDTGAAVLLVSSEIVSKMKVKPALSEADLVISQTDGSQMEIEGKILCPVEVGGVKARNRIVRGTKFMRRLVEG